MNEQEILDTMARIRREVAGDDKQVIALAHAALAWLRSQGEPVIKYVGVDAREDVHGLHPNDKEPRDDGLCEEFRRMGDDVGQGLSLYWKWAFASGWNAHKLFLTPQPAIPDGWQAIETYDGMKKKPAHAVFWFEGTAPARGQLGKYGLPPMMSLERIRGSRICTHWMPLPLAPEPRK